MANQAPSLSLLFSFCSERLFEGIFTPLDQSFLNLALLTFGPDTSLGEAVLCFARCLASSLASTHKMPLAMLPTQSWSSKVFRGITNSPKWGTDTLHWGSLFWLCFPLIGGFSGGSYDKESPAMQETWVRSMGQLDPLEKGMITHSSILAWKITWTGDTGGL